MRRTPTTIHGVPIVRHVDGEHLARDERGEHWMRGTTLAPRVPMSLIHATSMGHLLTLAREACPPTPAELTARVGRSGPTQIQGLTNREAAARCEMADPLGWSGLQGRGCRPHTAERWLSLLYGFPWLVVDDRAGEWTCGGPAAEVRAALGCEVANV